MEVFDQLAEKYQGEHSHNPFQTALIEKVSALLPAAASVLDLGCGTGVPTAQLLTDDGHRVVGVDIAEGMLRLAREQVPAAEFVHGNFAELPADFGRFEAVTAFFSLLMLSKAEIERTLDKVAGWLQPGGHFAIGMVNFDADSIPIEFMGVPVTVSGYLEPDLKAVLEAHGFTVESIETVFFTPTDGPQESQIFALARLRD
ncbi:ubiquinone/menaquinone biosynthesis C-methylase UbiE [Actinoplanes octamycinicus]|uniref:Ubiquinone/menaquinone biosynthesis C-methylase UbiE n=1 Tax=Actinoplanes octamycinicus TaxID=135948 RepID=A0A7W7GZ30_9ACTN|nr:class I SAM-dependent methyltransferase [Actinoplanes octamycinicus]MBB4740979.1 ubiquinone/menaquinone biosynthesis C-methylase UbiE [Actinoplanes octamycinicus]GIE55886.1 methyltransferase [Actinoplanes octamycinicus]